MKPLPTPLVEPGPALTAQESARYARHLSLSEIGVTGQRRLKAARVLVIGAGGLGSPVLQYLAAAGVGTLGIIDDDVVEVSNLQRQVVHSVDTVGEPKVDSAADAVARINPLVSVERHGMRLGASDAVDLVGGYDLVVDGADNFATRYLVSDACTLTSTPCVWGSVLRFEGRVSVFWSGPSHDGITYRDLHPDPPPPGSVPSCAAGGVIGALPGTLGSLMAAEAVKLLTGCGDPLYGRVLLHDALAMSFRELRIVPDPEAPLVTSVQDMTQACSLGSGPAEAATVTVDELDARLRSGAVLVDVREDWERDIVAIPGARAVPLVALQEAGVSALPDGVGGRDVIFHCRSGVRSALAVEAVASSFAGREESVAHLDGGVLEWVRVLHPEMPTY
ncbi:molybdopterin-synthase adenylyltransferase MoeB [Corynebacterium sp. AOP40-9SA-29]|uniref:molybdopterin-synthase adenylyltransferase MoeB n=1 Tax=Corynebacterium sp. AOP40-9SA-29 TaxID=3457677 RepID=UPI00403498A9